MTILQLGSEFPIKDMGTLHYFLGVEATHTLSDIHLSQTRSIEHILHGSLVVDSNECLAPMATSLTLSKHIGHLLVQPEEYRKLVGTLQHLNVNTQLDTSFSINKLYQFMHAPTNEHMKALKQLLRYF